MISPSLSLSLSILLRPSLSLYPSIHASLSLFHTLSSSPFLPLPLPLRPSPSLSVPLLSFLLSVHVMWYDNSALQSQPKSGLN